MFRKHQKGWLGIDIGTASVKVAQLVRHGHEVRVLAQSIVSRSAQPPNEEPEALWTAAGEVRAAVSLNSEFRGRHAATAMPMGFCDVHQVGTITPDDDVDGLVRGAIETITQGSADHLEYDLWPTERAAESGDPSKWNVLAVARPWADRIYRDVAQSGLLCHAVDGVPHVLARAVRLSGVDPLSPVGVLDWGFSQATFCVVLQGEPVYVRSLKDCSLERALSAVSSELNVSLDEAHRLLEKYGVRGLIAKAPDEATALISELMAGPVRQLEQELTRTISHVGFQRRATSPAEIYLFGGGALIAGLTRHLTRRLHLNTHVWSLTKGHQGEAQRDCLFGAAMALSALAWEEA